MKKINFLNNSLYKIRILSNFSNGYKKVRNEYFMFVYILSGGTYVSIGKEKKYKCSMNDYFLVRSNEDCFISDSSGCSVLLIFAKQDGLKDILSFFNEQFSNGFISGKELFYIKNDYNVKHKVDEIYNEILKFGDYDFLLSKLLITEFITGFVRKYYKEQKKALIPDILADAMGKLMDGGLAGKSTKDLEEYTHYSRSQLCRLVKRFYNLTPNEYIINLRLDIAYNLIQCSDMSISAIAQNVGYNSMSHFYRQFKKKFNILPVDLREK